MKNTDATRTVRLLDRRELAELLGVHPDTTKRWQRDGHLPPPIKVGIGRGGKVAWRLSDIRRWLRERKARC